MRRAAPDPESADPVWADAVLAATLFAVDPVGLGGVALRAPPGAVRDRWLARIRDSAAGPLRKLPLHVGDGRLLGGLDLAATLKAGRPVAERGLLADADGGILVVAMAERLEPSTVARLTAALDTGEVVLERDGMALRHTAHFGVVSLDEGIGDDERTNPALLDRQAFHVDLGAVAPRDAVAPRAASPRLDAARRRLRRVRAPETIIAALCEAALTLGVDSVRAGILALRAAKASAAIGGRTIVDEEDAGVAARLVLAPRATRVPVFEQPPDQQGEDERPDDADGAPEPPPEGEGEEETAGDAELPLADILLAAAQAAIPPDVLAQMRDPTAGQPRSVAGGRAGARQASPRGGRPVGTRRGDPRGGARLSLIETLRAAAPWQGIRAQEAPPGSTPRVIVRADDFRIVRFQQRSETTTIFLVDASGSSALNRLAEAKGAVELLLADCYVRRDQVALIAFRGPGAELLLPPTRSLVRAKRSLAGLPGGGGTPLATGLDAAAALADAVRRKGQSPTLVVMTDGRANTTRRGVPQRAEAEAEALAAARQMRASGLAAVLVDISPRPQAQGRRLADAMGARYLPLPYADARALTRALQPGGRLVNTDDA